MTLQRATIAGLLCLGLVVAGCASTGPAPLQSGFAPPPPPPPPPPPSAAELLRAEFAWSTRPGAAELQGAAVFRTGGRLWTCAGQSVALAPDTPTSAEHMRQLYGSSERALQSVASVRARSARAPGADFSAWVRSTACDAKGAFAFHNLPEGRFFIIARVRPKSHTSSVDDAVAIMQRATVQGAVTRVTLTPPAARPG